MLVSIPDTATAEILLPALQALGLKLKYPVVKQIINSQRHVQAFVQENCRIRQIPRVPE